VVLVALPVSIFASSQEPGVTATVNFDHIKQHYYGSHPTINPNRIVPLGPILALDAPHGRDRLS